MKKILRVSDPRELLALIPYQLGFHPRRSTVVLSLRGERMRVGVIARTDTSDLISHAARVLTEGVMRSIQRDGASGYVIAVYEDEHPTDEVLRELDVALRNLVGAAARNNQLVALWIVTPSHYITPLDSIERIPVKLLNREPIRWENSGRRVQDLASTVVSATMVLEGLAIVETREQVGELPAIPQGRRRVAARAEDAALARRHVIGRASQATLGHCRSSAEVAEPLADSQWDGAMLQSWVALLTHYEESDQKRHLGLAPSKGEIPPVNLTAKQIGELGAGMRVAAVRDEILAEIVFWLAGKPPVRLQENNASGERQSRAGAAMEIVLDPARAMPPVPERIRQLTPILELVVCHQRRKYRSDGLALLALVAWWSGSGARARIIADEAVLRNKSHRLSALLQELLDAAIPPGWVSAGRTEWPVTA